MFNKKKCFLFYIIKNIKYDIFKKYILIIFIYFIKINLKNNYQNRMFKNKTMNIKIILKILKTC